MAEESIAEVELLERMKSSREDETGRIRQGVLSSKSGLDEALKVIRGQASDQSRQKLYSASSTNSSVDYKIVHPIRVSDKDRERERDRERDLGATWSSMLQAAELKSSLEAKIQMLSDQIRGLKSANIPSPSVTTPLQDAGFALNPNFVCFIGEISLKDTNTLAFF